MFKIRVRTEETFSSPMKDEGYVEIIFDKLITVSHDQYSYSWLNLVAEVGGYVGLFLGVSVYQSTFLLEKLFQRRFFTDSVIKIV